MELNDKIRSISEDYLERTLKKADGTPAAELKRAEKRLGIALPPALREYYRMTGRCVALNKDYNRLLDPEELTIDGEYLVFMDENQEVVSWGIAVDALGEDDPVVWQRNNTPPEAWYSEEMVFTKFIETMLYWLRHGELPAGDG